MAREVINVGAAPNDGQGDPIRTAYIKTNNNFAELYSAVQLSPPLTLLGSAGNKAGMIAYSPTAFYYCFLDYDGVSVIWGELPIAPGIELVNGTSNVYVAANGNVSVSVAGTSNVAVFYDSGFAITGNVDVVGNVNVSGNVNYTSVTELIIGDPLIYIGANNNADIWDLGIVASYNPGVPQYGGIARDASDGVWKFFGNVLTEPTTVVDWGNAVYQPLQSGAFTATTGNFSANVTTGNVSGTKVSGTTGTFTGNVTTGNVSGTTGAFTNVGGTLTTAGQTNITSVGTLTSLAVTGNITSGNVQGTTHSGTTGTFTGNVTTGNVSGTTGAFTNVGGTLTTAGQTNITSVGTLTSLAVTGNITTGNANASGNISASFFKGDGGYLTNVTAVGASATSIANGTSSIAFTGSGGNATITIGGVSVCTWANTGMAATGNITITTPSVIDDSTGVILTNRMIGKYSSKVGNLAIGPYWYMDYGNSIITAADSLSATRLGGLANTSIAEGNALTAFGTSYGSKNAGLSFVTGTASDVAKVATGQTPLYAGNVNAIIVGYTANGPRVLVQDYDLSDDVANSVTAVASIFRVKNAADTTIALTVDGATGNVTAGGNLISNAAVVGTTGTFTGNVTAGNLSVGTGTVTVGSIVNANANGVGNIGSSTLYFNTVFAQATSAQYADLAEMYQGDHYYSPGTVLCFGGSNEVTIAGKDHDVMVAGIVSTRPAYTMNSTLTGPTAVAIALAGRVPCNVQGPILRGQMLVTAGNGRARAELNPAIGTVIGKALQDFNGSVGVIEIVVGRL